MSTTVNRLLTRTEAAELVGFSLSTFERIVEPAVKRVKIGRIVRIPESEIVRWIDLQVKKAK